MMKKVGLLSRLSAFVGLIMALGAEQATYDPGMSFWYILVLAGSAVLLLIFGLRDFIFKDKYNSNYE
jgi:hypothetical protein